MTRINTSMFAFCRPQNAYAQCGAFARVAAVLLRPHWATAFVSRLRIEAIKGVMFTRFAHIFKAGTTRTTNLGIARHASTRYRPSRFSEASNCKFDRRAVILCFSYGRLEYNRSTNLKYKEY